MKQEDDKLRNLLQDVFNEYEVTPEPEDWNRVAESLNKAREHRRFLWAVWSAAATILLLLALYTGNEYVSNKSSIATTTNKTKTQPNTQKQFTAVKSQSGNNVSTKQFPNEKKILVKSVQEKADSKNIKTEKVNPDRIIAANISNQLADNNQRTENHQKVAPSKELQETNKS